MRFVEVRRRPRRVERRSVVPEPSGEVLDGDVALLDVDARRVVGFQVAAPDPWPDGAIFRNIDWDNVTVGTSARGGSRLSGFTNPHRTFGYTPPAALRSRYAAVLARLHGDTPEVTAWMERLGEVAWEQTRKRLPRLAEAHAAGVEAIAPPWRFGEAWTSGIINRTTALPYHLDAANVPGCLSAMYVWKQGCEGGALHLDDYDVWLAVGDRSLTVFSGATVMHGVSPIRPARGGWRYSAVFYVRAGLAKCAPTVAEEVARAQLLATTHDHLPA
jgi:hypothetical protein